ncbi:RNA polymerase subunit AC19 [Microsporum audouinii]
MPGTVPEDESMIDAQLVEDQDAEQNEEFEEEDEEAEFIADDHQRITILPGAVETAASFQFEGEDHTLGNALRYVIMKK